MHPRPGKPGDSPSAEGWNPGFALAEGGGSPRGMLAHREKVLGGYFLGSPLKKRKCGAGKRNK